MTRSEQSGQMRPRRWIAVWVIALTALAMGLTACGQESGGGAGGQASSDENTWTHGILKPKGDGGYFMMAQERKFFEQQGVKVQIKEFVGNVQLVQALVSGAIDSGDTAPGPIYDAFQKGANIKIVGSTLPTVTYAIVAKDDIQSFADLQGKTIGASAPGAFPDEIVRAMMAEEGLEAKDLKVLNAGSDAQRVQALLNGRIDAAAVSVEFVPEIEQKQGFHVLAQAQDVVPDLPRFYLMANGEALQGKSDAAVKFIAGYMQGLCYAVENPDAQMQLTAKLLKQPADDPSIVHAQKVIEEAGAASPTSAIPMDKLEWLQDFRMNSGIQKEPVDFQKLVDTTFREKALSRAKLSQQCQNDPNAKGSQSSS
jgi:ABC-type nitrate/sulfonate/bicarbonate transport system substrate-binding protein